MRKDRNHFRYLLEQQKQDHLEVLDDMLEGAPEGYRTHEDSELSRYDNHPADVATELFDSEQFSALRRNEEFTIREINDALRRIETERYGFCERCGGEIGLKRLEALPHARNCIRCETAKGHENKLDKTSKSSHRAVEEDVLEKLMRGDFIHEIDNEEPYDGQQALEEVLSYGSSDTPQDGAPLGNRKDAAANGRAFHEVEDIEQISNEAYKNQLP